MKYKQIATRCKLVRPTEHNTVRPTIGVVYRCYVDVPTGIGEMSKGDCISMRDFNHRNIKSDTQQSTGVEVQKLLCLIQDNFLTQHVLEPT